MEFQQAGRVDADIGQAQGQRAGRAAFMQADLPALPPVAGGLGLIVRDEAAHVLHDDDWGGKGRGIEIGHGNPMSTGKQRR